jgi:hypothetical protein
MTRRQRDQSFTQRDATRALKAMQAAGIKARLEIDTMRRTMTIIPDEPAKDGVVPEAEPTPLEQWRAKRSGQG